MQNPQLSSRFHTCKHERGSKDEMRRQRYQSFLAFSSEEDDKLTLWEPQLQEIFKLKHEILLLHKSDKVITKSDASVHIIYRYIGGELLNV
ncbi:unnamed protein product [Musa banksii]